MGSLLALLLALAFPAQSETLGQEIGRTGLAATEARLAAQPARSDAEVFTLGGVQVRRAVEGLFEKRRTLGLTDRTGMLPLLRLPWSSTPPRPLSIPPP